MAEEFGGCGVHLSPWMHQEYTFRHRTQAESRQESRSTRKQYMDPCKTQEDGRKKRKVSRTGCVPEGGGTEAGFKSPHWGNCLRQWRSIWGCWRVQQLICGSLNKMRITQTILATDLHTLDRDANLLEYAAAGSCSIGIGEQSQGKACCWLRGRQTEGMWGRRLQWEMPVEESKAAVDARN